MGAGRENCCTQISVALNRVCENILFITFRGRSKSDCSLNYFCVPKILAMPEKIKYTTKNIFEHPINDSEEFREVFFEFLAMRTKMKKPATERAQKLLMLKLLDMSAGKEDMMIKLIDQSMINNWLDFYPLREERTNFYGGGFNNDNGKKLKDL